MRIKGWLLTFAMFVLVLDIGLERARRGRPVQGALPTPQIHALDGGNGQPPTPKP